MIDPKEKELIKNHIERELKEKGKIIINTEQTDKKVLAVLIDICTLNKLRDATN